MKTLFRSDWCAFFASTVPDGDFAVPVMQPGESQEAFYRREGWRYFLRLRGVLVQGVPPHLLPGKDKDGKEQTVPRQFGSVHIAQLVHKDRVANVAPLRNDPAEPLHGRNVYGGPVFHAGTDGLLTDQPMCVLVVTGADCPPVLIMDPLKQAIALVHSGREGTSLGIAATAVKGLAARTGSHPSTFQAIIGPGICRDHYPVDEVRAAAFARFGNVIAHDDGGKPCLDLGAAIQQDLVAQGLRWQNVRGSTTERAHCTYEHAQEWHSFRRDRHTGKLGPKDRPRVQIFCALLLT